MDISGIYIHDSRLLKVVEDAEFATVTMECELPANGATIWFRVF